MSDDIDLIRDFLNRENIRPSQLAREADVHRNLMAKVFSPDWQPRAATRERLVAAVRRLTADQLPIEREVEIVQAFVQASVMPLSALAAAAGLHRNVMAGLPETAAALPRAVRKRLVATIRRFQQAVPVVPPPGE